MKDLRDLKDLTNVRRCLMPACLASNVPRCLMPACRATNLLLMGCLSLTRTLPLPLWSDSSTLSLSALSIYLSLSLYLGTKIFSETKHLSQKSLSEQSAYFRIPHLLLLLLLYYYQAQS